MELLKRTIPVTCAVIRSGDRYLAVQRSSHDSMLPDLWEFPGGKVEAGETTEACIRREIEEELAVRIRILEQWPAVTWDYGPVIIVMTPFLAEIEEGDLRLLAHQAMKWLLPAELDQVAWAPADTPIVRRLVPGY